MKLLIATSAAPKDQAGFDKTCAIIRESLSEETPHMHVTGGILWTPGPGCSNLALELEGGTTEEQERFAHMLTMALMPAKWTTTKDPIPEVDTCELF